MKLFLFILFLFPLSALAGLTDGADFVVDDSESRNTSVNTDPQYVVTPTETRSNSASSNAVSLGGATSSSSDSTSDSNPAVGSDRGYAQTAALENANQASSDGKATQILGLAMGAAFTRPCMSGPQGSWACPLAVKSFMDAAAAGQASGNAAYTAGHLDPSLFTFDNPNYDPNDPYQFQTAEALDQLRQLGWTPNSDGSVSGPNGEIIKPGEFGTADSLKDAGLSDSAVEKALASIDGIKSSAVDAAKKRGVDVDSAETALASGAGGSDNGVGNTGAGGAFASSSLGGDEIIEKVEYRRKGKKKGKRMPASQAAEYSKDFNGTPIGIGMADIFLIVHKKYQEKSKKRTEFIHREY